MPRERAVAFAPGRVNLIGEHTDYNQGLALPFAIAEGVTVRAQAQRPESGGEARIAAYASDLGEHDEFPLAGPARADGWRAFVRGIVAELQRAGLELAGANLQITGNVDRGSGLSSSAALEVALCLALLGLTGEYCDRIELARLCARVENEWVGAQTGMLDQLACLYGQPDRALLIDFATLQIEPVPLRLGGWRLVVVDSGERHAHSSSGYNERREECAEACRILGIESLREAGPDTVARLPEPLSRRVAHVTGENRRVREAVAALQAEDLVALGALLNATHESLRENYEVSTPMVEGTVERLLHDGAAGARLTGGGFGGSVLGLFAPGISLPADAREVRPGAGAHLLAGDC
ncbi:MAG TPA: galactokinase family protein [Solirubrobacteraceae bacterium]|nr:galactokinase family protein [Solirubrobacteraceae bacterium]